MLPYRLLGYDRDRFRWDLLGECKSEREGITLHLARRVLATHIWVVLVKLGDQPPRGERPVRVVLCDGYPHRERLPGLPEFASVARSELPQPAETGDRR